MAEKYAAADFGIPEVQAEGAVAIESTIGNMRREIGKRCRALLRRARLISVAAGGHGAFRLRLWESRISQIREAHAATFSMHELRQLRSRCRMVGLQMEAFAR
jgi:hypothetical protein